MSLKAWADRLETPLGVGVDAVDIGELQALDARTKGAFTRRTFTQREQEQAGQAADRWSYLAGRFAAKEAVFKALAPITPEKTFDFRIVETLRAADGSPQVAISPKLAEIMATAGAGKLLVSISNESGFAVAFAVAIAGGNEEQLS